MKKIILLILDGLGDRPLDSLGGKTPLQAARKKNLNALSSMGMVGLLDPISPGIRPGSDTAHLSLLGYDPFKVYTGRGPFEALGLGMELKPGDIAFRGNFATVDDQMRVIDRRAGRIESGTDELAKSLNMEIDGVEIMVKEGVEHRAGVVFRGEGLSPDVTDVDPHEEGRRVLESKPIKPEAKRTAEIVNKFIFKSYEILDNHPVNMKRRKEGKKPANIIMLRGAGIVPEIENFNKKYNLKGACIVGVPLLSGLCRLAGMDVLKVPGVTGTVNTNMENKIRYAIDALRDYDFILINIKATDVAGHDGNGNLKKEIIERIDGAVAPLLENLDRVTLMVTGDHSTPCSVKDHTGDPLPVMVVTEGIRRDGIDQFDEISAARGSLRIRGSDVMNILMNYSERAEKFGA
ncbi:MAG TPA: 2,3-bisphosphoglycerate-independent phosphoglycerate mutase [Euryarchaeota archaeon]|nr:2,3-bisphosphoglycerate-independent phosphoglycerate mutase [Euryarchaeota archaeon]